MVAPLLYTESVKGSEPVSSTDTCQPASSAPSEHSSALTSLALPPRPSAEPVQLDPETRAALERELAQVCSEFAQRGQNLLKAEATIRQSISRLTFVTEWWTKAVFSAQAATYTYIALNPPNTLPLGTQWILYSGEFSAIAVALTAYWMANYLSAEASLIDSRWEYLYPLLDREKELRQQLGLAAEEQEKESA